MARPWPGDIRGQIEASQVQRGCCAIAMSHIGLYHHLANSERLDEADSPVQLAGDFLFMIIEAAVIAGGRAATRLLAHCRNWPS